MRNLRNFFMIAIFVLGVVLTNGTVLAQNGDEEQFPNGFVVRGEFLRFYNSAPDPWLLFGYPISSEMDMNGKRVQYFDRARFELTTNDKGSKIALANLGWSLYDEANVVSSHVPPSPTCRFFPKNGHNVCYNFLKFYDANNGPLYFGEPVSDVIQLGGQMVQYFDICPA